MQPPVGKRNESFSTHLSAKLFHSSGETDWRTRSAETVDDPRVGSDVMWNEKVNWEFESDGLTFIL